jgi:hypothetical protein
LIGRTDFEYPIAFDLYGLTFNDLFPSHGHEVDIFECSDPLILPTGHDEQKDENDQPI